MTAPTEPPDYAELRPFREEWVAEQLLAAPGGVVTRAELRAACPLTGSMRPRSHEAWQRRRARGCTGSTGSKAAHYVRKGLQVLEREGFIRRDGDLAVLVDREGLIAWLYEDGDADE